jgi:hypothetical protein
VPKYIHHLGTSVRNIPTFYLNFCFLNKSVIGSGLDPTKRYLLVYREFFQLSSEHVLNKKSIIACSYVFMKKMNSSFSRIIENAFYKQLSSSKVGSGKKYLIRIHNTVWKMNRLSLWSGRAPNHGVYHGCGPGPSDDPVSVRPSTEAHTGGYR